MRVGPGFEAGGHMTFCDHKSGDDNWLLAVVAKPTMRSAIIAEIIFLC